MLFILYFVFNYVILFSIKNKNITMSGYYKLLDHFFPYFIISCNASKLNCFAFKLIMNLANFYDVHISYCVFSLKQ